MALDTLGARPLAARAVTAQTRAPQARLAVLIGGQHCFVPVSQVGESVALPPSIAPVPLARDWLLGVANLHGCLHTVVDLATYAGAAATSRTDESRLLTLAPRLKLNAALLVTEVLGLRSIGTLSPDRSATPPAVFGLQQTPAWARAAGVDASGHGWVELDLAALAADARFLMAGL
jgi:twitching motility protein PilI